MPLVTGRVVLGFGPRREPGSYLCSFQALACFEIGPPLRWEERSDCYWSLPLYCGVTLLVLTLTPNLLTLQSVGVIDDGARQHQLFRFVTANSKSRYYRRSVGRSLLVSSPISGPRPDFCCCQTLAVLFMWGALSDERTGLPFVAFIFSRTWHLNWQFYLSAFYIIICQESGLFWVHIIYSFIRNSSIYVKDKGKVVPLLN
jgi:hypothetical protein